MANEYNTNKMKQAASQMDQEIKAFEKHAQNLENIIKKLEKNALDSPTGSRYMNRYKNEVIPAVKELEKTMKKFSSLMGECAKRYGKVFDNGNSYLSS